MKNSARLLGATLGLAAITCFTGAIPASAAVVGQWADWDAMFLTADFANPDFPDATFTVSGESTWNNLSPQSTGEGFGASTPVGALVGANSNSTAPILLKVETVADNSTPAIVTITFASPVPAGQLVLALSDIDSDHSVISMTDGSSAALTGTQIIGTATHTGFNFADSASTYIPTVVASANSVTMGDAPDATDGSTGWVRPSVDVSSITIQISTEDSNVSAERIWLGQVAGTPDATHTTPKLAATGVTDSVLSLGAGGIALLGAGTVLFVRRRNA